MFNFLENLLFILFILLTVAYLTVAERKTIGYIQRRLGPNAVGYYGLLIAIADAVKLIIKESVTPTRASGEFEIGPEITLTSALLVWAVIPFGPVTVGEIESALLFALGVSSVGVFGTLYAGWSSDSKFSLLGSIRATAQLISYELVLTTLVLIVVLLTGSLDLTVIVESQRTAWNVILILPLFVIFFIASVAETNRPPFDLTECESELVSGHITELSASSFVFFFLAEYISIVYMCVLCSLLYLGGYLFPIYIPDLFPIEMILDSISLGFKSCLLIYSFIWVRASFPRVRFDQLLDLCWLTLLPVLFALLGLLPSIQQSIQTMGEFTL